MSLTTIARHLVGNLIGCVSWCLAYVAERLLDLAIWLLDEEDDDYPTEDYP